MTNENRGPDVGEMAVDAMDELEHLMGTGEVVITSVNAGHGLNRGSLDITYRIVPGADPLTASEGDATDDDADDDDE